MPARAAAKTAQAETGTKARAAKTTAKKAAHRPPRAPANTRRWELRLYVAGQTCKSLAAFQNLKLFCEEHLHGQYTIEVIDLPENPQLARGDQILAISTLVRKLPEPVKKIIGDLSNTERVLVGLDLRPAHAGPKV